MYGGSSPDRRSAGPTSLASAISASTGAPFASPRYSPPPYRSPDSTRRSTPNSPLKEFNSSFPLSHHPQSNIFGGLDESLLSAREALVDMKPPPSSTMPPQFKHADMMYHSHHPSMAQNHLSQSRGQDPESIHMLGPEHHLSVACSSPVSSLPSSMVDSTPPHPGQFLHSAVYPHSGGMMAYSHHPHHHPHHHGSMGPGGPHNPPLMGPMPHDTDTDPRELEAFSERFKQRRIKLGVTQCDVGKALANLKLPGVGALSQSTICRFESLTLSHNNMVALKPVLQAWLEAAEAEAAKKDRGHNSDDGAPSVLPSGEKKRKRTSIAAPEKRSLEAYFAVQPRPSGEKIAAIAEKLDLKKNVVRVWFCNQRQKQKRMKFASNPSPSPFLSPGGQH
ncbi:unnamed protein product [Cyprideis torosa]|uniref:POU domain protein n=1 Tax=Cyprideis torosa TaxID=163714 RepID=A0A7R8W537_9CRUS|nr:unnamed protein product [Cyprideis torosa]CAG0884741.1 unnamed protein product [Cyprideis torosa]